MVDMDTVMMVAAAAATRQVVSGTAVALAADSDLDLAGLR